MASNDPSKSAKHGNDREDRLKAALKANMAKRKAQAKGRTDAQQIAGDGSARGETGED